MISNDAKLKLSEGKALYGLISPTSDPIICELVGQPGIDFYMIDGEHGALGPAQAVDLIRACENCNISPWARIRSVDEKLILQYLDAGVVAVMMPGIHSMDQVQRLVEAVKYPPFGKRGLGPVRAADYMKGNLTQEQYVEYANTSTLVFPQMEDIQCLNILEDILDTEGVDGVIIGPRDLAMSMGYYDGPKHEEVQKVIDQVFDLTLAKNKIVGTVAGTSAQAKQLVDKGAQIILNSVPNLLHTGLQNFIP